MNLHRFYLILGSFYWKNKKEVCTIFFGVKTKKEVASEYLHVWIQQFNFEGNKNEIIFFFSMKYWAKASNSIIIRTMFVFLFIPAWRNKKGENFLHIFNWHVSVYYDFSFVQNASTSQTLELSPTNNIYLFSDKFRLEASASSSIIVGTMFVFLFIPAWRNKKRWKLSSHFQLTRFCLLWQRQRKLTFCKVLWSKWGL